METQDPLLQTFLVPENIHEDIFLMGEHNGLICTENDPNLNDTAIYSDSDSVTDSDNYSQIKEYLETFNPYLLTGSTSVNTAMNHSESQRPQSTPELINLDTSDEDEKDTTSESSDLSSTSDESENDTTSKSSSLPGRPDESEKDATSENSNLPSIPASTIVYKATSKPNSTVLVLDHENFNRLDNEISTILASEPFNDIWDEDGDLKTEVFDTHCKHLFNVTLGGITASDIRRLKDYMGVEIAEFLAKAIPKQKHPTNSHTIPEFFAKLKSLLFTESALEAVRTDKALEENLLMCLIIALGPRFNDIKSLKYLHTKLKNRHSVNPAPKQDGQSYSPLSAQLYLMSKPPLISDSPMQFFAVYRSTAKILNFKEIKEKILGNIWQAAMSSRQTIYTGLYFETTYMFITSDSHIDSLVKLYEKLVQLLKRKDLYSLCGLNLRMLFYCMQRDLYEIHMHFLRPQLERASGQNTTATQQLSAPNNSTPRLYNTITAILNKARGIYSSDELIYNIYTMLTAFELSYQNLRKIIMMAFSDTKLKLPLYPGEILRLEALYSVFSELDYDRLLRFYKVSEGQASVASGDNNNTTTSYLN